MKALIASLAPMRTRADHSTYSAQTEGKLAAPAASITLAPHGGFVARFR